MIEPEVQKAHVRNCLEAAIVMWEYVEELSKTFNDEDLGIVMIPIEHEAVQAIKAKLAPFFPAFTIDDNYLLEVIERLSFILQKYELTSCGLFNFAHMLDHVFDLEDLLPPEGEVQH